MLNSLYIKNYRILKELRLDSLDQVNLITGKNNTGKSSFLEAIAIYASKANFNFIGDLLKSHGESFRIEDELAEQAEKVNIDALSSLFSDRLMGFSQDDEISIGEVEDDSILLSIRFIKYIKKIEQDPSGEIITRRFPLPLENETNDYAEEYKIGLHIAYGANKQLIPLERNIYRSRIFTRIADALNVEFIRTGYTDDKNNNATLFDNIALTDKEKYIIEGLKIIEPTTEKITFIGKNSKDRIPVIKLSNHSNVLPLKSMGDGINRILTIILALVNCENGFLLIDEFENGLHYTVQKQLWKIIFHLAGRLNVQVFVTTHSEDCISSFQEVLNDPSEKVKGKLIRLDNVNGVIKQTEFSPKELKIANEQDIEVR